MRFSKSQAEAQAVRLAEEFVAANGGASWTCIGAKPNVLVPGHKRRKNIVKWSVAFDRSDGGALVDGPAIVDVDIETGFAAFP
jgi:hypothetical protein